MVKNVTIQFDGVPYFLYEEPNGIFKAVQSITCFCDDYAKQGYTLDWNNSDDFKIDQKLEEIKTNDISLLVRVPERGFIGLEIVESCRKFAKISKEEYVSPKTVYHQLENTICESFGHWVADEYTNGKKVRLYEVKPRLFRRI